MGYEMLDFCLDIRHNLDGRALSSTRRPRFAPKEIPLYSFLLEVEWTPELQNADRSIRSLENFPRTPRGIEAGSSHPVAQCLNQPRHGPQTAREVRQRISFCNISRHLLMIVVQIRVVCSVDPTYCFTEITLQLHSNVIRKLEYQKFLPCILATEIKSNMIDCKIIVCNVVARIQRKGTGCAP